MKIFSSVMAARGSFKRQIILAFVVGFFLLISAFAVYLVNSEKENLYGDSIDATTGLAQSLAVSSLSWVLANDVVGLQEVVHSFQNYPELRYAMVTSPSGRVLAHSDATKVGQFVADPQSLALIKAPPGIRILKNDASIADVAVPVSVNSRSVGWARVALGREDIAGDLRQMVWRHVLFVLSATILALLAALLIANRLGARIGALMKVADDVRAGNIATRVRILGGEDEITKLADTFNQMLNALARNEEHLRAASLYTRSLIEASLDPLVTISAEGKITDVNRATEAITGGSRSELIGTDFSDYFTAPDKARAAYKQVFAQGFVTDYSLVLRHRDGHVTEVLYNASIYRNEAGEVLGVLASARDVTERNKAAREVAQLSLRNKLILDSAGEGIYGMDIDGRCTFVNPAALQLLGFRVEELTGQQVHSVFHHTKPDGQPYPVEECPVQAAYKEGAVHRGGDLYWRKDGSSFPVEFISTPILEAGKIIGAVVTFRDITERKLAEEQLRRSAHSLAEAQRVAHLGSWNLDLVSNALTWSDEIYRIFEIDPEKFDASYDAFLNGIHPDDRVLVNKAYIDSVKNKVPYDIEHRLLMKDARVKYVNEKCETYYSEDGKPLRSVGTVHDITERKRAEVALRANEHFLETIIENIPNMLFVKDAKNLNFVRFNKAGEKLLGYSKDELIGKNDRDFFPKEQADFFISKDREIIDSRELLDTPDEPISTKSLGQRYLHTRKIPIFADDGSPLYLLGISEDITERKKVEEELRRYKDHLEELVQQRTTDLVLARNAAEAANRAKSVFLSSMSHELRTPLNAILGFSSMMRKNPLLQEEQRQNLDIINRSGEHLLTLINDVLEMAKIEAGRVQVESAPFDLGSLVRDVTDMMHVRAQEKGLQLLIDQSSEFPRYIKGDEARVRQVLINLLGNAVKFTHHGGVTVRFGLKPHATPQRLLIEVEDSGIGISAADQKRVFEPFVQFGETAAQQGTGLGLSIARQFVQLMGGTISFESTLGKGSTFRVELPMERVASADVAKPESTVKGEIVGVAPGQPEYRILVVEDQLDNQRLLSKLMKNVGFQAKVAENGEQAVALFQSWQPQLIWMDRRMPVMDGLEATRRIRELPGGRAVKIVAVTASAFTEQRDEVLKAGMDDFVRKPYRFNEIYESLAKQLGVQYTYAEAQPVQEVSDVVLTAAMLAVLPADLRRELHDAIESLEGERITAVIGQVASFDSKLHKTLSRLADNFDYPAILKALQTNPPGTVT